MVILVIVLSVPILHSCFSQGDNFENAIENIKEAIELYLEDDNDKIFIINSKKEFMVPVVLKQKRKYAIYFRKKISKVVI